MAESRLLRNRRGLSPGEGAISVSEEEGEGEGERGVAWRDGVRINSEEAWLLRQADNMGQQFQRHLDPEATSVPVENNC